MMFIYLPSSKASFRSGDFPAMLDDTGGKILSVESSIESWKWSSSLSLIHLGFLWISMAIPGTDLLEVPYRRPIF